MATKTVVLHAARPWRPKEAIGAAKEEAEAMEQQYYFFAKLKNRCPASESKYYEWECITARRQMMDAQSFLVALRRRGFVLALEEMHIERTVIDEEYPTREVPVGTTYTLLTEPVVKFEATGAESVWSSMASR
jgi:hypothetical protein